MTKDRKTGKNKRGKERMMKEGERGGGDLTFWGHTTASFVG